MALGVVFLDVLKLRRLPKSRHVPIQLSQPFMESRIPGSDIPDVTFEMLHIHWIEADDGRVQTHIRLCDSIAKVKRIGLLRQVFFGTIEGGEELRDSFFVRFLRRGESGPVDAVVDIIVSPVVRGFDFFPQFLGV